MWAIANSVEVLFVNMAEMTQCVLLTAGDHEISWARHDMAANLEVLRRLVVVLSITLGELVIWKHEQHEEDGQADIRRHYLKRWIC